MCVWDRSCSMYKLWYTYHSKHECIIVPVWMSHSPSSGRVGRKNLSRFWAYSSSQEKERYLRQCYITININQIHLFRSSQYICIYIYIYQYQYHIIIIRLDRTDGYDQIRLKKKLWNEISISYCNSYGFIEMRHHKIIIFGMVESSRPTTQKHFWEHYNIAFSRS